ncbi:hypothetical protein AM228_08300 [Planktothricoides sp. SR001]|uniref:hypothetical protein n=1 Tax=Planktothricoides sp. SR001 TaxID=1705388 RepID=UPI0006BF9ABB|nr:hypothetical protein [Planktothricoides sp. SR001]KOR37195.1 hypothetical protein AM228_08300 [Planktothricoides sp. SR001]
MKPRIFSLLLAAGSFFCVACQPNQSTFSPIAPTSPTIEYDAQLNQSLIVMRVTGITLGEDSTAVNIAITNGQRQPIQIDLEKNVRLYDRKEKGVFSTSNNQYLLSLPQDISQIQIEPGTTMKGQLVFIGRLSPEANFIRLDIQIKYNYNHSEPDREPGYRTESFSIDDIEIKRGNSDGQNN